MFGKRVNNCVKADESVEFDQGAFDNIFKPRIQYKQDKKREPRPYDNHPTKRSPQPYDKGPNKDEKLKEFQKNNIGLLELGYATNDYRNLQINRV